MIDLHCLYVQMQFLFRCLQFILRFEVTVDHKIFKNTSCTVHSKTCRPVFNGKKTYSTVVINTFSAVKNP